jgi:putative peptidoglycan lipid II flippase
MLSKPISAAVYLRGTFSALDVQYTSSALCAYSLGLWSISCQVILVRAYLAKRNTTIPAYISAVSVLLNIVLAIGLMGPSAYPPQNVVARAISQLQSLLQFAALGHVGLALAGSLVSFVAMALLLHFTPKINAEINNKEIISIILPTLLASAAMAACLYAVLLLALPAIITLLLAIPLGMSSFFVASSLLRIEEAQISSKTIGKQISKLVDKIFRR